MPRPTRIPGIDALPEYVGKPLGPSQWVVVTQQRIDAFAEATGDRQWIHLDARRARAESPFGQTVAHGYLTLALLPVMLGELIEVEGSSMAVNYGVDKLRLPTPVPSGARIRLSASIADVRRLPSGAARVELACALELEESRRPACTARVVYVYYP